MLPGIDGELCAHGHNRPLSARSARFGGGARPQARSAEDGRVGAALFFSLYKSPKALDHLGSLDVLSDEKGGEHDRRSYDAFGARRNPTWGELPPACGSGSSPSTSAPSAS